VVLLYMFTEESDFGDDYDLVFMGNDYPKF